MCSHQQNSIHQCLFCNYDSARHICENESAYAIFDNFPVNKGHVLIIPKRHFESFFEATETEILDIFNLLKSVKERLSWDFNPEGYNIGINIGKTAGQTIAHTHLHVIPRYEGDVSNPKGGIRNLKKALVEWEG